MNNYTILESISDGVFTVDLDFRITYINSSAEKMIQISRSEAIGKLCCEVFHSNLCEGACALRQTLEHNRPIIDLCCFIINNEGCRIPVSISTAVLKDEHDNIIGGAETFRNLSDLEALRHQIDSISQIGDLISHSSSMQKILSQLQVIANSDTTVLIGGETGSGKELLAKTIHSLSRRRHQPFVAINCGAFPETLLESELFGYKRGAFTGAERNKPGRFELAEGGTLFFDEIGEISAAMQVKLLRVLQEHSYEPLGAVKSNSSDVRIICATHRNLEELIAAGTFRQDLYYRINVINLQLPPLRERREDIPFLIDCFIKRFNLKMGKNISGVSNCALKRLINFDWPGNIRELENVIERSMVFCQNPMIDLEDLPEFMTATLNSALLSDCTSIQDAVRHLEGELIAKALQECNNTRREAAKYLNIDHTTFYRKLKRLNINIPDTDGRSKK